MATETVTVASLTTDNANWTLAAGASKLAAVQSPSDSATSYISCAPGVANSNFLVFTVAAPSVIQSGDTISNCRVEIERRRGTSGGNGIGASFRLIVNGTLDGGTRSTGSYTSTAWATGGSNIATNPVSGVAWTYSDANNLSLRILCSATPTTASMDISTITVIWTYTAGAANQTATPGTLALTTAAFAPSVTATANQSATPSTLALTTTGYAPTLGLGVIPGTAALATTSFAPSVTVSDNQSATPGVLGLAIEAFAPSVTVSDNQSATPVTATLALEAFAPTVTASDHQTVTPDPASLILETFAPDVEATTGGDASATPEPATLTLATFAPTVTATTTLPVSPPEFVGGGFGGWATPAYERREAAKETPKPAPRTATPAAATLRLTTFAPAVVASSHRTVTPRSAVLELKAFAPVASASNHQRAVVGTASLRITTFAATVSVTQRPAWDEESELDELLLLSVL